MPNRSSVSDLGQLFGDLVVGAAQVALLERLLALEPDPVEEVPEAFDATAVGRTPPAVEHALERLVEVPVRQQVVGELREDGVGVVDQVDPGCRPTVGRRTARSSATPVDGTARRRRPCSAAW